MKTAKDLYADFSMEMLYKVIDSREKSLEIALAKIDLIKVNNLVENVDYVITSMGETIFIPHKRNRRVK